MPAKDLGQGGLNASHLATDRVAVKHKALTLIGCHEFS